MRIEEVTDNAQVREFLRGAGSSLDTFRYYATRDIAIVRGRHLATLLGFVDEIAVAYGHLDRRDDGVWLGLCVAERALRRGYGEQMLRRLAEAAAKFRVEIRLSVDVKNAAAIGLYKKCGFAFTHADAEKIFMRRSADG